MIQSSPGPVSALEQLMRAAARLGYRVRFSGGGQFWTNLGAWSLRWGVTTGNLWGYLIFGAMLCYLALTSVSPMSRLRGSWMWLGRRIVLLFRWDDSLFWMQPGRTHASGLLRQMEGELESAFLMRMERSLQHTLDQYRPSCRACRIVMYRDHYYARSLLTRHGEVRLRIPVFRCAECFRMESGMDIIGHEESYSHAFKIYRRPCPETWGRTRRPLSLR